jgi:hypothetical protein
MLKVLALAGLVALVGCGDGRQAVYDAAAAQCRAAIPRVIGNYAKRQRCLVEAATNAGFRGPAEDLLNATRMELADKVDGGTMTPAEANVEYAHLRYDISQQQAAERAANADRAAAILMSLPQQQPYVAAPVYQMPTPQPWSATCNHFGSITTCSGN